MLTSSLILNAYMIVGTYYAWKWVVIKREEPQWNDARGGILAGTVWPVTLILIQLKRRSDRKLKAQVDQLLKK